MKIVNKKKFIRSIVILVSITLFVVILFSNNIALSHQELQYKEIYVDKGETLWEIATSELKINKYYNNADIREVINDIKKVNNLNSSILQIGQMLEIPTL